MQTVQELIVGMKEQDAQEACEKAGLSFRVTHRDGVNLVPFNADDHDGDRLNVEIENGKVKHFLVH